MRHRQPPPLACTRSTCNNDGAQPDSLLATAAHQSSLPTDEERKNAPPVASSTGCVTPPPTLKGKQNPSDDSNETQRPGQRKE